MRQTGWFPGWPLRPARLGEGRRLTALPLSAPVEVLRDRWGIPHVFASNEGDLMCAQGFLHAQDRLWQMESLRRLAGGTLAGMVGAEAVGLDSFSRLAGFDALRRRALAALAGRDLRACQAYLAGVNAYLETARRLPLEFRALGFRPTPWGFRDLAGALPANAWFLQTNYQEELLALRLRSRFSLGQWNELFPSWPGAALPEEDFFPRWRGVRIGAPLPEALAYYPELAGLAASGEGFAPGSAAASAGSVPGPGAPGPPAGPVLPGGSTPLGASNNWVAARGEGGAPILANDPHLGMAVPQIWYLCHLHCPELNVCGGSLPGVPGVIIGRNEHLAWGVTNLMADCTDLYLVCVDPRRPTRYLYRGEYRDMEVERTVIPVAGRSGHTFTIHRTLHGPVITRLEPGVEAAACLKWYGTCDSPGLTDTTIRGFFQLNRAGNVEQALAAVDLIGTVGQNFVMADTAGRIAWRPSGRLPLRKGYSGRLPADGSSGDNDWSGFLPPQRMPLRVDPPEGWIATANDRSALEGFASSVSHTWCAPYRRERIVQLLERAPAPSVRDFQAIQTDLHSLRAERIVPVLLGLRYAHPDAVLAAELLRGWDFVVSGRSAAALVFAVFLEQMTHCLLDPLLGEGVSVILSVGPYLYNCLDGLFAAAREGEAPPGLLGGRSLDGLCEQALAGATAAIRDALGARVGGWRWDRLHTFHYRHPGARGAASRWLLNRGRYPAGGCASTVNVAAVNTAHARAPLDRYEVRTVPSLRIICSLAAPDATMVNAPMGQSGQPGHRHYDDMIRPWMNGQMMPLPLTRDGAERICVRRTVLSP